MTIYVRILVRFIAGDWWLGVCFIFLWMDRKCYVFPSPLGLKEI